MKETLDNLEEKVKERTAELEKAYKSLKESKIMKLKEWPILEIGIGTLNW